MTHIFIDGKLFMLTLVVLSFAVSILPNNLTPALHAKGVGNGSNEPNSSSYPPITPTSSGSSDNGDNGDNQAQHHSTGTANNQDHEHGSNGGGNGSDHHSTGSNNNQDHKHGSKDSSESDEDNNAIIEVTQ